MAGELCDVVNSLWGETKNFSYEGKVSPWRLHNVWITLKPLYGRPVLVNATGSPASVEFAAKYSDLIFITSPGGSHIESVLETLLAHIATIREAAAAQGREIKTLINPYFVSRDTPEEAKAYAKAIADGRPKAKNGPKAYDSDAHAWRGRSDQTQKQSYNFGGNIDIIGSPEQVRDQLVALYKGGINCVQLGFYNFAPDLEYFGRNILPLLKDAGLRVDK